MNNYHYHDQPVLVELMNDFFSFSGEGVVKLASLDFLPQEIPYV